MLIYVYLRMQMSKHLDTDKKRDSCFEEYDIKINLEKAITM